jgi:TetR/AcrR family transcriptional regulator, transcriptional repressor for nem operon
MARVVKEQEHAVKRNEILDAAQRFVYSKGYNQMSIQDILNDLQISKGAFYHYFDSKQALLEALIDRMVEEAEPIVLPIAQDPQLPALEKLHRFFDTAARWKTARKDYLLSLMSVWYADENSLIRHKTQTRAIEHFAPMLAGIIRQGIREGVMDTSFPDQLSDMAFSLLQGLGDTYLELLSSNPVPPDSLQRAVDLVTAYNVTLERMLGAPAGSMNLIEFETLKAWFVPSNDGA